MPSSLSRRSALLGLSALGSLGLGGLGLLRLPLAQAADASPLVISAMPASPSVLIARMIDSGYLESVAPGAQMHVWRTPDQMRAGVLGGDLKVFGTPSYSCANLHNRGVPVRMLNILTWGLLYMMTRDDAVQGMADLAGKKVVLAFRNDAPDLIFRIVLSKLGLEPGKDLEVDYVGTPTEATQLLLAGRYDNAILPEPAATASQMRGAQDGITIRRAADLTAEYGRLTGRPARLAQAGMGIAEDLLQSRPEVVAAIHQGCIEAAAWTQANPDEAGALGGRALELPPPLVTRSLPNFRLDVVSSGDARPDMETYFEELMSLSPDIVGGALPGDDFYWSAS